MDRMTRDIVLALVKEGDKVRITPIDTMPNLEREFKVDYRNADSFVYGASPYSDGYCIPFWAIKGIEIIG